MGNSFPPDPDSALYERIAFTIIYIYNYLLAFTLLHV